MRSSFLPKNSQFMQNIKQFISDIFLTILAVAAANKIRLR
jgi:hypothetical protein